MSSQRGNISKKKAPKHQNKTAFRNDLHDGRKVWSKLNNMEMSGVCGKCKEIVEWKIKYKKYKPLSQPKTCTICKQKTVKKAYFTVCVTCSNQLDICAKCGKKEHIEVKQDEMTEAEKASQQSQLEQELKLLTERQRRTFHRLQQSGKLPEGGECSGRSAGHGLSDDELTSEEEDDQIQDGDSDHSNRESGVDDRICVNDNLDQPGGSSVDAIVIDGGGEKRVTFKKEKDDYSEKDVDEIEDKMKSELKT